MKTLIKASAAVVAAALFGACNFAQPTPPCAVGHGGFAAELVHTGGATSGACFRTGDIIGVQKYRQDDGTQDIYLKPESISVLDYFAEAQASEYTSLASGTLADNDPNAEGFCTVASLSPATGTTLVGENLTYQFTNVEFFVQGSVPGTQFRADLVISDDAGCTANYDVRAMYPVVFCNELDDEATFGEPKESVCRPVAEGEPPHVDHVWSFVAANPLFDATCKPYGNPAHDPADYDYAVSGETAWHLCVPATDIPALLEGAN